MDNLKGIRIFRTIVEAGGFAAAADRLDVSAPMISKYVADLEKTLGARLLNRSSRAVSLTEAGSSYLEQCRQALDILDAAAVTVSQAAATPRGELKITAPVWCATPFFANLLADYRRSYPQVRLDMHLDNHMVDIVEGGFDLALRATGAPSPGLIARALCRFEFHLVATPDHLASLEDPLRPDMIMPNYLQPEQLSCLGLTVAAPAGLTVMKSSDTTLSYHAVCAGTGAAFLPGWLVDADVAAGRLLALPRKGPPMVGELFAVYSSRRQMPPKLRTFIDFLSQKMALGALAQNLPTHLVHQKPGDTGPEPLAGNLHVPTGQ